MILSLFGSQFGSQPGSRCGPPGNQYAQDHYGVPAGGTGRSSIPDHAGRNDIVVVHSGNPASDNNGTQSDRRTRVNRAGNRLREPWADNVPIFVRTSDKGPDQGGNVCDTHHT
jgi:hypothetical protein